MFGYIVPIKGRLSAEAREQYETDYCGLCRCLGKRYGFAARFLVRYDMIFLYALLSASLPEGGQAKCFCPANPFCKKACRSPDAAMEYCADVSVVLAAAKLEDTVADERGILRFGARLGRLLLRRKLRRAESRLPRESEAVRTQLQRLNQLEKDQCPSLDGAADPFAVLLSQFTGPQSGQERILRQILYHTGRCLYLIDALDDLKEDIRFDHYNPLRFRFQPEGGSLSKDDQQLLLQTVQASMQAASAALDLLPCQSHRELLENIIHFGMPTVMQAVAVGRFHRRRNRSKDERPI